ncbi:MAG: M15 family metallopeptidase [Bacillota bacterium]
MRRVMFAVVIALIIIIGTGVYLKGYDLRSPAQSKKKPTGQEQAPQKPPPEKIIEPPNDFVIIQEYIPSVRVELIYFTENNFTGKRLYDSPVAYLRRGTADNLKNAADEVAARGYRLKVWDAYRPPRIQFKMWEFVPDARFVADPHGGYSYHSRGCAVDLTLIDQDGKELDMPTGFDDFTPKADRDYSDVSAVQGANAGYLEKVMVRNGFTSIRTEWWHFVDREKEIYGVAEDVYLEDTVPRY